MPASNPLWVLDGQAVAGQEQSGGLASGGTGALGAAGDKRSGARLGSTRHVSPQRKEPLLRQNSTGYGTESTAAPASSGAYLRRLARDSPKLQPVGLVGSASLSTIRQVDPGTLSLPNRVSGNNKSIIGEGRSAGGAPSGSARNASVLGAYHQNKAVGAAQLASSSAQLSQRQILLQQQHAISRYQGAGNLSQLPTNLTLLTSSTEQQRLRAGAFPSSGEQGSGVLAGCVRDLVRRHSQRQQQRRSSDTTGTSTSYFSEPALSKAPLGPLEVELQYDPSSSRRSRHRPSSSPDMSPRVGHEYALDAFLLASNSDGAADAGRSAAESAAGRDSDEAEDDGSTDLPEGTSRCGSSISCTPHCGGGGLAPAALIAGTGAGPAASAGMLPERYPPRQQHLYSTAQSSSLLSAAAGLRYGSTNHLSSAGPSSPAYGYTPTSTALPGSAHPSSRPGTASSNWSRYDLDCDPDQLLQRRQSNITASSSASGAARSGSASRGQSASRSESTPARPASRSSQAPTQASIVHTQSSAAKLRGAPQQNTASTSTSGCGSSTSGRQRPGSGGSSSTRARARTGGGGSSVTVRPLHPAVISLEALAPSAGGTVTAVDEVPVDEKSKAYPYVHPPAFPGTNPTICFSGSAAHKQALGLQPLMHMKMFVKYGGIANNPVKAAFREAGYRVSKGKRWHICWGGMLDAESYSRLHEFQRVNHFPGTWELGHKGHLYRNVYNARRRHKGDAFDIIPRFYILPRDYEEFRSDLQRYPDRLYIQKPTNMSRGRGIRMVTKPDAIPRDAKDLVVQHYIADPLLLNGYKFDMRVYVVATCLDPLKLYVYTDGLARLATEQYSQDKADLKKRCVHLTNYSVNKKNDKFVSGGDDDAGADEAVGSKWSLKALRQHLQETGEGPGWPAIWRQVHDIAAKALIAAEPRMNTEFKMKVPHRHNCFEVWGFDIMLDSSYRAWLLEVNTCPSLASDAAVDRRVKYAMVADALHLVGPVPYDQSVYEAEALARRQARLTGISAAPSTSAAAAAAGAGQQGATSAGGASSAGQQAALQSGAAVAAAAAAGSSGASGMRGIKTVQDADDVDFRGLKLHELPEMIAEAEAEYARRQAWERVFPCPEDPMRYLDLFETPRLNNILLCKYYSQQPS